MIARIAKLWRQDKNRSRAFSVLKHMTEIDCWNQNEADTVLTTFAYVRSTAIDAELNYRSTGTKLDNE